MRTPLFFLCLFLSIATAWGQKENNNWVFGSGYGEGLTFSTTPPSRTTNSLNTSISYPCALSDTDGNLLLYTNGITVWDRQHNVMPNGTGLMLRDEDPICGVTARDVTSVNIVPDPSNNQRYYIVGAIGSWEYNASNGNCESYLNAKYCMVDMSLNGGLGDVVPGTKNTLLYPHVHDNIAAGIGRCNKWLLFMNDASQLLAFEVTPSGIGHSPRISSLGFPTFSISKLKLSNDEGRLAVGTRWGLGGSYMLHLFDFDVTTGLASNGRFLDSAGDNIQGKKDWMNGFAFSADNSKLYYWGQFTNVTEIRQMDLSLGTHSAVVGSKTTVYNINAPVNSWDMMLGPDQKIYMAYRHNADWLVINSPNKAGTACDPRITQIPPALSNGTYSITAFQNWIPGNRVSYSYTNNAACTAPAQLSSMLAGADSYLWSNGATTKDIGIIQGGTYWVKAMMSCGAHRIDTFHIGYDPVRPISDTFSCDGAPITIPMQPGAIYNWASGGPVITKTGTYTATITVPGCGAISSSFQAIIYPPAGTHILPADTIICNAQASGILKGRYEMGQYLWSNGSTSRETTVTQPGTYWLSCNTPCGLFTDTVNVSYCIPRVKDIYMPPSVCVGNCVDMSADVENFPVAYNWGVPAGATATPVDDKGRALNACFSDTGIQTITLQVSSLGGASKVFVKTIKVLSQPIGMFKDTALKANYNTLLLLPTCTNAEKTDWYKDKELICENCPQLEIEAKLWRGNYTCIVHNATCMDTCTYLVEATNIPTDVWLPGAFTPNGDGKNDLFHVLYNNPNVQIMSLSVFNRQGVRVYRSTEDNTNGWNGRYKGTAQSTGTYFWVLQYKVLGTPNILTEKGDVTLIR